MRRSFRLNIKTLCVPALVAYACVTGASYAQDKPANYPLRPVRIIVGVAAGAGNDAVSRAAAQMLNDKWAQTVVVDNRAGGGTVISVELGAQAAPDGYTLLSSSDTLVLGGALKRVNFDVRKAFEPIVTMTTQPYILVVEPSLPAKS